MKRIFRVIGLIFVQLLFVVAGAAFYIYWPAPHWGRSLVLIGSSILGMLVVNILRGKARAMFWMSEQ